MNLFHSSVTSKLYNKVFCNLNNLVFFCFCSDSSSSASANFLNLQTVKDTLIDLSSFTSCPCNFQLCHNFFPFPTLLGEISFPYRATVCSGIIYVWKIFPDISKPTRNSSRRNYFNEELWQNDYFINFSRQLLSPYSADFNRKKEARSKKQQQFYYIALPPLLQ